MCDTRGTITPFAGLDVEADCKKLQSAMKGLGTDEKAIISVICYRSNSQRQELKTKFKSMYGKDLIDNIKSELSGDFEKVIVGLLMTPADFDAFCVSRAVRGLGTDEDALVEILASRTNAEMQAMKVAYKKNHGKEMEKAVATDVSGDFKRALVSLIVAARDVDGPLDDAKVKVDAKDLFTAGEGQWGTDESAFNRILVSRSYSHLRAVFDEYETISKKKMESAIVSEMSGDICKTYLSIVRCCRNPAEFFANALLKSMKGVGTDETTLNRVMVSRSEIDMEDIKEVFKKKNGKTLYSWIKGDTGGDYERVLLAICRD